MIEFITCETGDWSILKVDGVIIAEGHTISTYDWLRLLRRYEPDIVEIELSDKEMEELY